MQSPSLEDNAELYFSRKIVSGGSRDNSGKSENYTSWKSYIQIKSINNSYGSILRLTIIKIKCKWVIHRKTLLQLNDNF